MHVNACMRVHNCSCGGREKVGSHHRYSVCTENRTHLEVLVAVGVDR